MKLYTKTGDAGTTSLVGGIRIPKDDPRLEAYGTIDELNSHIGLLMAQTQVDADTLTWIQNALFAVGSLLATDLSQTEARPQSTITTDMVSRMEHSIDALDAGLPPLRSFILPGGTAAAAQSHVCRTVCRRAERNILTMLRTIPNGTGDYANLLKFINRLSDYFFVLGRKINNIAGEDEKKWDNAWSVK